MDSSFLTIDALTLQNIALTLVHFIWQALLVAVLLKITLITLPQKKFHLRYSFAALALVALILSPIGTYLYVSNFGVHSVTLEQLLAGQNTTLTKDLNIVTYSGFGAADSGFDFFARLYAYLNIGSTSKDIVLFWCVGVVLAAIRFGWNLKQTYKLTYTGVQSVCNEIQEIIDGLQQKMHINKKIKVLKSSLVCVPVVIGCFRPVVLLPLAVAVGLDRQQLSLILAHEFAHIKRHDFFINFLQNILQVLFFFHPCVYWVNKIVREEREFICDDIALNALGCNQDSRLDLAKALLNTAELTRGNFSLVAVAASGGHLKKRVLQIIAEEKYKLPSKKGFVTLLSLFIAGITLITASMSSNRHELNSPLGLNKQVGLQEQKIAVEPDIDLKSWPRTIPIDLALGEEYLQVINGDKKHITETDQILQKLDEKAFKQKFVDPLFFDESSVSSQKHLAFSDNKPVISNQINKKVKPVAGKILQADIHHSIPQKIELPKSSIKQKIQPANLNKDAFIANPFASSLTSSTSSLMSSPKFNLENINLGMPKQLQVKSEKRANHAVNLIEPKALSTPYPAYPAEAFAQKLTSEIKVDFIINENGRVANMKFETTGARIFVKEVRERLRRWRYIPAEINGQKIAHSATMYFEFEVPNTKPFYKRNTGTRIKRYVSK